MAYRTSHGNARKGGKTLVWENAHTDPARQLPEGVDASIARDSKGKVSSSEAASRLAKLRHTKPDFVRREITCSPEFSSYNKQRQELTRARIAELSQMTGGCSRAVCALVRASCWGTAFGEFTAAQAALSGDADLMDRAMSILAKASVEGEKARRLAIDEAATRKATQPTQSPFAAWTPALTPKPTADK
jgi:hypothetical protein